MKLQTLQRWLTIGAMLALPVLAYAQEATLTGTVSDSTGGALPGVTVRALHEASGNSFEAVTDERGDFRIPVRVGGYKVTADLSGFAPVSRTVTLLVGQVGVVDLQLSLAGVQESVTVTGEAPLLDVTQSTMGGNIDPRQMQELPVQGRNWMDLALLAPGARLNSVSSSQPVASEGGKPGGGNFQFQVDGQQATAFMAGGQPQFSRDALAEFEFLSSRFDATQGRSTGVQVNAVTKSGSNTPAGTLSGYFRDDRFNAADSVAKRVLPYQNQQTSGTLGGPIRRDKLHIFGHWEYEREPQTFVFTIPYPQLIRDLAYTRTVNMGGTRVDAQFSPQTRLMLRASTWKTASAVTQGGGTGGSAPSNAGEEANSSHQLQSTLTQVLSNRAVNEVKVGYLKFTRHQEYVPTYLADIGMKAPRGPVVLLPQLTVGGEVRAPAHSDVDSLSFRDDFTYSFTKRGRHTMKMGGEYLHQLMYDWRCVICEGELNATRAAPPVPIERIFPDQFNSSTWNLGLLSSTTVRWRQSFGPNRDAFGSTIPRYTSAAWVQDDWTVSPRLTLNLGLRYDLEMNAFANDAALLPFRPAGQPDDTNNIGPRVGFNFSLNDRTVMRGGYGLYYGTVNNSHYAKLNQQTLVYTVTNDNRPDFASNPYNGPTPTFEAINALMCTPAAAPGCIKREINQTSGGLILAPGFVMPHSTQGSIGIQRQIGGTMSVEADYVYVGNRDFPTEIVMNLTYNPATGANYPFTDLSRRVYNDWSNVSLGFNGMRSNQHSLQTAFTKRFSQGWQASGTYTLSGVWDEAPRPRSGLDEVPFPTAPDLGGEYTLAANDQRHRAVFNGIWDLPYDFQLSGLYFYGSGLRYQTRWGIDLRNIGTTIFGEQRLRPDGTIVPRNNFVGGQMHRVDMRLQRRFALGGRASINGIMELFNIFNRANYGSYNTREVAANYGQPSQNTNVAYAPRTLQLGFRFAF